MVIFKLNLLDFAIVFLEDAARLQSSFGFKLPPPTGPVVRGVGVRVIEDGAAERIGGVLDNGPRNGDIDGGEQSVVVNDGLVSVLGIGKENGRILRDSNRFLEFERGFGFVRCQQFVGQSRLGMVERVTSSELNTSSQQWPVGCNGGWWRCKDCGDGKEQDWW